MIKPVVRVADSGQSLEFWCSGCKMTHVIPLSRYAWDRSTTRPTIVPSVQTGAGDRACECLITAGVAHYTLESFHAFAGRLVPLRDV